MSWIEVAVVAWGVLLGTAIVAAGMLVVLVSKYRY